LPTALAGRCSLALPTIIQVGLPDAQSDAEFISDRIKVCITPIPDFVLTPHTADGQIILTLTIKPGMKTPYYYSADGSKQAYVRIGNESIPAPDYMLNELILKGTNRTYDVVATEHTKKSVSFTLLQATYLHRTRIPFEESDFGSFGLITDDDYLTRAGTLLTDQHIVYNSRVFCTRWDGLEMGSVFEDALDDKEYEGNLIHLLTSGCDFVKNNSKVRFVKEAMERIDKPDYSERAVMEALVNALIHRDYLVMGAEVHIDMYDDRLEISSPGGMYEGPVIQERDIENVKSKRRNPVIADLFHRMKYMERRGSGLKKIVNETKKLPGYTDELKPIFRSTSTSFSVILKNVNYNLVSDQDTNQVSDQDIDQVSDQDKILAFCVSEKSKKEICDHLSYTNLTYFTRKFLNPLIENGKLKQTIPNKPSSKNQKYVRA